MIMSELRNRWIANPQYLLYFPQDYKSGGAVKDDEVAGEGNSYTTEFRQYDSRIGRWLSLDPLMKYYPHQSGYCAFNNNPIYDPDTNPQEPVNNEQRLLQFKKLGKNVVGYRYGVTTKQIITILDNYINKEVNLGNNKRVSVNKKAKKNKKRKKRSSKNRF